jgi:hypothetical protein
VSSIRSCYKTFMRFYRDRPDLLTEVQWYFVPNDRAALPFAYSFGSQIYDRKILAEANVGEVYNPHPYRKGNPPYPVPTVGLCGTPQQWRDGALSTDPLPPLQPGGNVPICCGQVPIVPTGGMAPGGRSQSVNLVRRGGLAIGGYSNNTRYVSTGGLAIGGLQIHVQLVRTGGMAVGGLSNRSKRVQTGGMAVGGRADRPAETPISGGLAIGGQRSGGGPIAGEFAGGLAMGGPSRDPNPIFGEGGLAIGGNVTSAVFPPGGKARYGGLAIGGVSSSGLGEVRDGGLAVGGIVSGAPPVVVVVDGGLAIGGQTIGGSGPPGGSSRYGGLATGGIYQSIYPCSLCETTPATYVLTIAGFTAPWTAFNGTFTLPQDLAGECAWQFVDGDYSWTLTVEGGAVYAAINLTYTPTGAFCVWDTPGPWTCCGTFNWGHASLNRISGDSPTAVTVASC